jgi:hypothetical protein
MWKDTRNIVYVTHTCRNKACESGFLDTDDNNARMLPPTTKYCPECKARGFEEVRDIRGANGRNNLLKLIEEKRNVST